MEYRLVGFALLNILRRAVLLAVDDLPKRVHWQHGRETRRIRRHALESIAAGESCRAVISHRSRNQTVERNPAPQGLCYVPSC